MGGRAWLVNTSSTHIQTPLFNAIAENNLLAVKALIAEKCNLKSQIDEKGYEECPLEYAAELGRVEVLKLMLESKTRFSKDLLACALIDAALNGHLEAVQLLVAKGANLGLVTSYHTPLTAAVEGNRLDVVKFLVEAGSRVEQFNGARFFPLSIAAYYRHMEIFEYLEPLTLSASKKKEARKTLVERHQNKPHPVFELLETVGMGSALEESFAPVHNNSDEAG